jgi:polyvinyl alcohol dehydrogenase (cytochrome)
VPARGGSIDSAGPVLAGGLLVVNSGYDKFGEIPGNLLLVLGPADKGETR